MNTHFFESLRKEFPVTEKYVYLDHAGVAPLSLWVRRAVEQFLAEAAEGGAFHYPEWAQRIVEVRRACADLVHASPEEIAFVKNTSHGLSLVAGGLDWKPGDNMLIFEREFPSNIYPWLNIQGKGVEVRQIPSRDNRILLDDVERLIDSRTRLLAVSSVQFSTSFRIDLQQTGELCRRKGILFCVDAIQSLGVIPVDVKAGNIDFLSADAHKWLLGPEGIGIFYCRRELAERIHPPLVGWKSVQNDLAFDRPDFHFKTDALRFEEGSMNLMGVFGLGAAVAFLLETGIGKIQERVQGLGDLLIQEAEARGFSVVTPKERANRGGSVTFRGNFDPAVVKSQLLKSGIMVNARGGGLRVSPHFYNTPGELERFFIALQQLI